MSRLITRTVLVGLFLITSVLLVSEFPGSVSGDEPINAGCYLQIHEDAEDDRVNDANFAVGRPYESIEGATIELYDAYDRFMTSGETGSSGTLWLYDLDNGVYSYRVIYNEIEVGNGTFRVGIGERYIHGSIFYMYSYQGITNNTAFLLSNYYTTLYPGLSFRMWNENEKVVFEGISDARLLNFSQGLDTGWYHFEIQCGDVVVSTGNFHSWGPDPMGTATISGRITDLDTGEPIPGARMVLDDDNSGNSYVTASDSDGYYRVVVEAGTYDIDVTAYRYGSDTATAIANEGSEVTQDLELDHWIALYGYVTDSSTGDPLEGARIDFSTSGHRDYSGYDGYYEIWRNPHSGDLEARLDGYDDYQSTETLDENGNVRHDIPMDPERARESYVTGQVKDSATDEPIPGVWVELYDEVEQFYWHNITDQNGEYTIHCYSGRTIRVEANCTGYYEEVINTTIAPMQNFIMAFDLDLRPHLFGEIRDDESGDPVEGATITIVNQDNGDEYRYWSEEDGTYEIMCEPGDYDLTIECEGYLPFSGSFSISDTERYEYNVDLEVDHQGEDTFLRGRITEGIAGGGDGDRGAYGRGEGDPLAGALVRLIGDTSHQQYTDNDGYFNISCEHGEYDIRISLDEFEDHMGSLDIRWGKNEYDAALDPELAQLYGFIRDADTGDALQDVMVEIEDAGSGEEYSVSTDHRGAYSLEIPAGTYDIWVGFEDYEEIEDSITLNRGDEKQRNYDLSQEESEAIVYGVITDAESGNPLDDIIVSLESDGRGDGNGGSRSDEEPSSGSTSLTSTNEDGEYDLSVWEGDYLIIIEEDGYERVEERISVENDESYERNFALVPVSSAPGTMSIETDLPSEVEMDEDIVVIIIVTDGEGEPIEGAELEIGTDTRSYLSPETGTTDEFGEFAITIAFGVQVDEYESFLAIQASANGFEDGEYNGSVSVQVPLAPWNYEFKLTGITYGSGSPGDVVRYDLTVKNQGDVEDTYSVKVAGDQSTFIPDFPDDATIEIRQSEEMVVNFTIPTGVQGGSYTITLVVTSEGNPSVTEELTVTLVVLPGEEPEEKNGDDENVIPGFPVAGLMIACLGIGIVVRRRNG